MARRTTTSRRRAAGRGRSDDSTFVSRAVFCTLSGISERELVLWEHEELIGPSLVTAIDGRPEPLYDPAALRRARVIRSLAEDLDVNLAGIEVILHLLDQMGR